MGREVQGGRKYFNKLRTWVEVERDGWVYAGELLRAVLNIVSDSPGVFISLAGIRVVAEWSVEQHSINEATRKKISLLSQEKSSADSYGGGVLFDNKVPPSNDCSTLLCYPHTIVPIDRELDESIDEWIIRMPQSIPPSHAGKVASIKYKLEVGLKVMDHPDIIYTHSIHVLPAFCSFGNTFFPTPWYPQFYLGDLTPFASYFLLEPIPEATTKADAARVTPMAPRTIKSDSVLDRYNRYGICPSLDDFNRFPRHPIQDIVPPDLQERPPSTEELFKAMTTDGQPVMFALKSGTSGKVATVKLSRDLLRLGEELTCTISFVRGSVEVFQLYAEITCTQAIRDEHRGDPTLARHRRVLRRHEEACWLHRQISFSMSLPSTASGAYSTLISSDLFISTWAVELTFICAPHPRDSPQLSVTPVQAEKNIIECTLPLRVIPSIASSRM